MNMKNNVDRNEGNLYLPCISIWFLKRTANEVVLRLSYLESLFNYLYYFPGGIPKRVSSYDVLELLKRDLNKWEESRGQIEEIYSRLTEDLKKGIVTNKAFYFREIAKINYQLHQTFKNIQIVHRFLDRRIDSLALFPLIPRRFARMSAIKSSALWREIAESIISILPFESTDLVLTWEQIISAKANPYLTIKKNNVEKAFSEISLPVWNIYWFQQSLSLYHELAEILIIKSLKNKADFYSKTQEALYYKLYRLYNKIEEVIKLHLGSIGGFTSYFNKSITNEIMADTIGLLYGGVYYYIYFILSFMINAKISSGLAYKPFSPLSSDFSDVPSKLEYNELDFSRFKELLRYKVLIEIFRDFVKDGFSRDVLSEGNVLFSIIKSTFSEPSATTGIVYENIDAVSDIIRTYVHSELHEDLNGLDVKKLGEIDEILYPFPNSDSNKQSQQENNDAIPDNLRLKRELADLELTFSNILLKIIEESGKKDGVDKRNLKALLPIIAFGIFVERVKKRINDTERKEGRKENLNSRITRVIHAIDESIDLNRYNQNPISSTFYRTFELISILAVDAQHYLSRFHFGTEINKGEFKKFWALGHYTLLFIGNHYKIDPILFREKVSIENDTKIPSKNSNTSVFRREIESNTVSIDYNFLADKYWTLYSENVLQQENDKAPEKRVDVFLKNIGPNDILLWVRVRHDFHFPSIEGQQVLKIIKDTILNALALNSQDILCLRSSSWPNVSFLIKTQWNRLNEFRKYIKIFEYVNRSDTYILIPFEYLNDKSLGKFSPQSSVEFITRLYVVGKDGVDIDTHRFNRVIVKCYVNSTTKRGQTEINLKSESLVMKPNSIIFCNPDSENFTVEQRDWEKEREVDKNAIDKVVLLSICGKKIFLNLMGDNTNNVEITFSLNYSKEIMQNIQVEMFADKARQSGKKEQENKKGEKEPKMKEFPIYKFSASLSKLKEIYTFEKKVKNRGKLMYGVRGFFHIIGDSKNSIEELNNHKLYKGFNVKEVNFTTGVSDVSLTVEADNPLSLKNYVETLEKIAEITGVVVKPVTSLKI